MRFTGIRLNNWRNFKEVNQSLSERVFIIGPNAAGKSNFLDVFRFLKEICEPVGGGFQQAVDSRMGISHLRSLLAREKSDISIEVAIQESESRKWNYRLVFGQRKSEKWPTIREERIEGPSLPPISRPTSEEKNDPIQMQQTLLENRSKNQSCRPLIAFLNSIQYCHVVPSLIKNPRISTGRSKDPFGSDFLGILAETNAKNRKVRIEKALKALKTVVPHIQKLELEKDERGIPHLRANYKHWRPQGAWQNESDLSEGTLRLIGILWALQEETGPFLLEEPEHSLHVEVVRSLPQLFARVQRTTNRQIFVTTHSMDLLSDKGIPPSEILLLTTSTDGTEIKSADRESHIMQLYETGLPLSEVIAPYTRPPKPEQMIFAFG